MFLLYYHGNDNSLWSLGGGDRNIIAVVIVTQSVLSLGDGDGEARGPPACECRPLGEKGGGLFSVHPDHPHARK